MTLLEALMPGRRATDPSTIADRRATAARRRFRTYITARLTMWEELASNLTDFSLPDALELIRLGHSENGLRPNDLIAMVAESWIPRIRSHQPFADVIAGAVTDRERLMIAITESEPHLLPDVLTRMHRAETQMADVKQRWRASIREPLGLLALSWAMLVGYAYTVIWQMTLYPQLPRGYARMGYDAACGIFYYASWAVPLAALIVTLTYRALLQHWLTPARTSWEAVWPFSLYKSLHAADFLLALTILTIAGKDLPAALRSMAKTANKYLAWQISKIEPLARSASIGDAIRDARRNFPDSQVNAKLAVYSGHRDFPKHLERIAEAYMGRLVARMEVNRKVTGFIAVTFVGLLQVVTTLLMLASSIPNN